MQMNTYLIFKKQTYCERFLTWEYVIDFNIWRPLFINFYLSTYMKQERQERQELNTFYIYVQYIFKSRRFFFYVEYFHISW